MTDSNARILGIVFLMSLIGNSQKQKFRIQEKTEKER